MPTAVPIRVLPSTIRFWATAASAVSQTTARSPATSGWGVQTSILPFFWAQRPEVHDLHPAGRSARPLTRRGLVSCSWCGARRRSGSAGVAPCRLRSTTTRPDLAGSIGRASALDPFGGRDGAYGRREAIDAQRAGRAGPSPGRRGSRLTKSRSTRFGRTPTGALSWYSASKSPTDPLLAERATVKPTRPSRTSTTETHVARSDGDQRRSADSALREQSRARITSLGIDRVLGGPRG